MRCIRWVSVHSALFICFTVPARADTAPAGKPITFDCVDLSTFDATYYFAPPRNTPLRVTATYGGATHELTRDIELSCVVAKLLSQLFQRRHEHQVSLAAQHLSDGVVSNPRSPQ